MKTEIMPGVSDHEVVLCHVDFSVSFDQPLDRFCFNFVKARWRELQVTLAVFDWKTFIEQLNVDAAAQAVTNKILQLSKRFIPFGRKLIAVSRHPG